MDLRPEYLFIRALETCNANCFMCEFALSKDRYRFPPESMRALLPRAREQGIRYVRLTGGEPLVHREIGELVAAISDASLRSSLITNGWLLTRKLDDLTAAGLQQVIVSIDGMRETHDEIRGMAGLFDRAIDGVRAAVAARLAVRVNTTCGPRNFRDMPRLQDLLTDLGVGQWELSSLKLERPLGWSAADRADVDEIVAYVYEDGKACSRLVPMGKVWCGEPGPERQRYFDTGITPRADGVCLLVRKVRYLDARNGRLFPCSLLPHRPEAAVGPPAPPPDSFSVNGPELLRDAEWFEEHGPNVCTGCSTTAAGYSNALRAGTDVGDWAF